MRRGQIGKLKREAGVHIICPKSVGVEFGCEVWTFLCPVIVALHRRNTFQRCTKTK